MNKQKLNIFVFFFCVAQGMGKIMKRERVKENQNRKHETVHYSSVKRLFTQENKMVRKKIVEIKKMCLYTKSNEKKRKKNNIEEIYKHINIIKKLNRPIDKKKICSNDFCTNTEKISLNK